MFFLFNQEPMDILEPHAVVGVDSGGGDSSEVSIGVQLLMRELLSVLIWCLVKD